MVIHTGTFFCTFRTPTHLSLSSLPLTPLSCFDSSPWTNQYTPPLSDGTAPSPGLRKLEVAMNDAFDVYRDLYALPFDSTQLEKKDSRFESVMHVQIL